MALIPLIFIVGPTCSGKSKLALELSKEFEAEIVNTDSVQVYKGVDIGTAKPSLEELNTCPHHLYSFVDEGAYLTAGRYKDIARDFIEKKQQQDPTKPLLFVGGSGFYIRALTEGMYDVGQVDEASQKQVDQWNKEGVLHEELQKRDPEYAKKLPPQDHYRLQRALGLILSQGKSMTEIQKDFDKKANQEKLKNPILKIGLNLDRQSLLPLVEKRCQHMWDKGLLEETKQLLEKGLKDWKPLSSIGYKEAQQSLLENWSKEQFVAELTKNTLRLAKRQRTWFQADPDINWFDPLVGQSKNWSDEKKQVHDFLNSL